MMKGVRWTCALVLVAALSFMAVQAQSYGEAYALQHRTHMQLADWQADAARRASMDEWHRYEQAMQEAISIMPENAAFFNTLGLLYQYRAFTMEYSVAGRDDYAGKAIDLFRQSTMAGPAWMYAWKNLAQVKLRAGQIDGEYARALLRTAEQGPWERDSVPVLLEMIMLTHAQLSLEQEKQLEAYLIRLATAKGVWLGRPVHIAAGRWDTLCTKLEPMPHSNIYDAICP